MMPKEWGVTTTKSKSVFVHILKKPGENTITVQGIDGKVQQCQLFKSKKPVKFKQANDNVSVDLNGVELDDTDTVIEFKLK
jgi:alpha-L-fucosidase